MKLAVAIACFVLLVLGFVSALEETPSFVLSENEAEAFATSEIANGATACVGAGYVWRSNFFGCCIDCYII